MEELETRFDFGRRKKFIFYPKLPDQIWGPVTLLSTGVCGKLFF